MSYNETDAYENIAKAIELKHCICYHVKEVVISMTKKQLSNPTITKHEKVRLENRLKILLK